MSFCKKKNDTMIQNVEKKNQIDNCQMIAGMEEKKKL